MGNPDLQSSSGVSSAPDAGTSAPAPTGSPSPPPYESVVTSPPSARPLPALLRRASSDVRPTPRTPLGPLPNVTGIPASPASPPPPPAGPEAAAPVWERLTEEEVRRLRRGTWPHEASSLFACLCCLIGMFNISRFALLVYVYKGYFVFEFVVLTVILGVPFLYAMMTIGQFVGSGMLDMWYISPAFKGLGYAFLYLYALMGVYTAVPIAWMFVYFKDSFITTRERYRWALCQTNFAADSCIQAYNSSSPDLVGWTAPSYFHARVLDRKSHSDEGSMGDLRFEIAFHLAIIWLLVFVCLSRGLRSLGKVVFVLGTFPLVLMLLVSIRFMEQWSDTFTEVFSEAGRSILTDSISWLLAAREVFLIWGVLGGAVLHLTSHNKLNNSINKTLITVVCVGTSVFICGALLCLSAMQILRDRGLVLVPSSFEEESLVKFLQPRLNLRPGVVQNMTVLNLVTGDCLLSPQLEGASGYQVLRLATEIMPAALAVEGVRSISSFWSICFYGTMIIFGLGQQITLWFCVVESIVAFRPKVLKAWQTIITFITCNVGFLFGLPMTTNMGIYIVFFLDICVASLWWIVVLFLIMLVAVLFIRGQPYGTDQLVTILSSKNRTRVWLLPLLTFQWNVLLPVSYLVISIAFMRWTPLSLDQGLDGPVGYRYWPPWVKRVAFFLQVCPLILSALVCLVKAYCFLTPKTQMPLHERIQAWCCPLFAPASVPVDPASGAPLGTGSPTATQGVINGGYEEDPPPKYTPPPSYSTATSRLIIKQLINRTSSISSESDRRRQSSVSVISTIPPLPPSGLELVSYDPEPDVDHVAIHPGV